MPKAIHYLQGLFQSERDKRNIERMVEQTDSNYQSQQQFISDSPWSSEELMTKIGIDEVVLFSRTLFLSDFQTDIIQNGGWLDPSPRSESVCIGGARKVIKNF
ncbi:MAG: hypothetical protein ACK5QG_04865, partial [Bacteroidota bacterium]|nr:hypothetical protein [Cytophagales bacterium]